jgi:hypothetical protein
MPYETLFVRLSSFLEDKEDLKFAKKAFFRQCKLDLKALNFFVKDNNITITEMRSRGDIKKLFYNHH